MTVWSKAPVPSLSYVSESRASRSTESSELPLGDAAPESSSSPAVYEYQYFAPGEDWYPRPMVPIAVQGPKAIVSDYGLADTGADTTSFPMAHMTDFGIERSDCDEEEITSAAGIGRQFIYPARLRAQVEDVQFEVIPAFMETPVILLGQEDFFTHFEVTFDHRAQKVTLRPYPPRPEGP